MAAVFATSTKAALARRSVHVRMYPTARTFNERREVLRVLERFGEVTMFRSYKASFYPIETVYSTGSDVLGVVQHTESGAQLLPGNVQQRCRG